jgi:O-antigen ligase
MFNKAAEKTASLLILVGATFTTVFLVTGSVTDPVNITKLAAVGGLGLGLFSLTIVFNISALFRNYKIFLLISLGFVLAGVNSILNSGSPLSQNIYGSYGRNTGFIAYLLLLLVCISVLTLEERLSYSRIVTSLQVAGIINVIYCAWVILFGDFLAWSNPYQNILGLFGNPNFISAFLGIFIATVFAYMLAPGASLRYRIGGALVSAVAFYEILDSNAIQGIVVTSGGIAIVGFFAARAYLKSNIVTAAYVVSVIGIGTLALLGALQKGPFTFIYKTSVSLRGAYWNAGITMGSDHPLTGVGMDSYGDWYRRARSENAATVLPGPKTITNAAHNVVIDFFAFGGYPLLLTYLGLLLVAAIAAFKVIRRNRSYDAVFVAMFAAWSCYQVQSLISINQVGLALWGWILTGALIAYERVTRENASGPEVAQIKISKKSTKQSSSILSPQLVAGLGIVVGTLIAVPPMSSDMRWRLALDSKDATKVLAALEPAYLNPVNSQRYAQAVQLFASSNLLEQAHTIAMQGVEFNPDYFDAWRMLYFLPNSTEQEKKTALENLKRLDPRNPDVLAQ